MYSAHSGRGGFDCEDASHVTHPCLYNDSTGAMNIQAPSASSGANGGLYFERSTGGVVLRISDSQSQFSTTPTPNTAGNFDLGAAALPWGNLWLGTAATNNFKFQPAAIGQATTVTIADPAKASVGLPLVIASGTSTLNSGSLTATTCQATVTTAATGAATTDAIEWSFATVPGTADGLTIVSAAPTANNVNFVRCNPTAASQTTTAIVVNWKVIR